MTPAQFNTDILIPSLARALPVIEIPDSAAASRLLLAIAGQESGHQWRYQLKPGGPSATGAYPARGFWQFERSGGVAGVLKHPASTAKARALCDACHVYPDDDDVWRALEGHDTLATGFARLLLWTDPRPLPTTEQAAWEYYLNNWRPGRPHPDKWAGHWNSALALYPA